MQVYVVTTTQHMVIGVYTKMRRAQAMQEELIRDGENAAITTLPLNEEQDNGPPDEG